VTHPRPDRRVERTKQALRDALIELMHERELEGIHVADIAERANVGRSTFYAHYRDKRELLVDGVDQLKGWLRARIGDAEGPTSTHPALRFAHPMIEHAAENRALFRALVGTGAAPEVMDELQRMLAEIVRVALGGKAKVTRRRPTPEEPLAEAIAGAFLGLLVWWLERDGSTSAAELEATFVRLMQPGLDRRFGEGGSARPPARG